MNKENIKQSLNNLFSTRLRTFLAMLGILVGTASVVTMVSTGQMAAEEAMREFKNLGTDLISLSISSKMMSDSTIKKFDLNDALQISTSSPQIKTLAPYTIIYTEINFNGNKINGAILGVTNELQQVMHLKVNEGRFISNLDHYEQYCVVGQGIYKELLHYASTPLLNKIKLGNYIYTIIGVLNEAPESSFLYQDLNNAVLIPIRTTSFLMDFDSINNIVANLKPDANIQNIKNDIEQYLRLHYPTKDVFIRSAQEIINSMEAQHRIFTGLLALIGSISLLVGGIGVMNIMLVSVLERRREIGIRLALGARRQDIQNMFLTESTLLSVIGGLSGIVIGIIFSFIVAEFLHWHFFVFILPPLIGFAVSALIGIFFGYYPAYKASQLDPIQTLKAE